VNPPKLAISASHILATLSVGTCRTWPLFLNLEPAQCVSNFLLPLIRLRNCLGIRHAPGRARTGNPVIRSHMLLPNFEPQALIAYGFPKKVKPAPSFRSPMPFFRSTLPILARLIASDGHDSRAHFIGQEGHSPLTLKRQCRSQAESQTVFAPPGRA
jgi:hypothetical protein